MKHPLKAIYCNQYFSLKPRGKVGLAREYGTALSTVAVMLVLFALYMTTISLFPGVEKTAHELIKDIFGFKTGQSAGQILGLFLVFVSWPIVRFTVGTAESYQNTIEQFLKLSAEEQQKVSKYGIGCFMGSVIIFGAGLLLFYLLN